MMIYGIPTCETVRKARKALPDAAFRDVRAAPLSAAERAEFIAAFGDKIINRASMSWRKLSPPEQAQDADALLVQNPTLMKRPVIRDQQGGLHLGWTRDVRAALGIAE